MTKISIVVTVFNEEKTVAALLGSLLDQTKRANQIVIVDGGSRDKTVEIIRHYQKKDSKIKLLVEKCSRSRGRNLGCEIANGDIIAMTDAGCVADKNWLKNSISPFENTNIDVVAGFYRMTGSDPVSCAMMIFMGIMPSKFDVNFLPSTRSVAFKKDIWEKVGGFPEGLTGAAEDTVFSYKLIKAGAKFSRMKNAIVEWGMPDSIKCFYIKIRSYAMGDAKSKIWIFPGKGLASHNIHSLFILGRYLVALVLLFFCLINLTLLPYWFIGLLVYFIWSFRKIYLEFRSWKVAICGPVLQIISDLAVIKGFLSGIIR